MKRESGAGPSLSAVFVDYDNIYLSLRRKSEDAAKRFAKDAASWLKAIELGTLITPTNSGGLDGPRRIVMNRCYGNPVPRRNQGDNSTDMTSFPFVRHHFLRAGFEIVDCPPLTQQLKNSSDIRMVMDVRDYLHHDTYFDEFIILSGDADFTPVLHRLRAHARRTVIFANDYTAAPYTAISDGEIREADLINLLLNGQRTSSESLPAPVATPRLTSEAASRIALTPPAVPAHELDVEPATLATPAKPSLAAPVAASQSVQSPRASAAPPAAVRKVPTGIPQSTSHAISGPAAHLALPSVPAPVATESAPVRPARLESHRDLILKTIVDVVRTASGPVAIETLADRAVRTLGQERTAGTNWAGAGSFRGFLLQNLPADIRLTDQSPYYAYDIERHGTPDEEAGFEAQPADAPALAPARGPAAEPATHADTRGHQQFGQPAALMPVRAEPAAIPAPATRQPEAGSAAAIQQAVARIFEACQAPPLGPLEYRLLFELMAAELNENKLSGAQTVTNVLQRATDQKLRVTRDDVRFVFDVVSEVDPWFEQGATASLFAGRFRNFVVHRCRTQGLSLSADDIDLIDRLFTGGPTAGQRQPAQPVRPPQAPQLQETGWGGDGRRAAVPAADPPFGDAQTGNDDFPRIVRSRMRG